jgi:hypothetical protein
MAKNYTEKILTIAGRKEIQIKTTLRFHLTPVRITSIKNTTKPSYTAGGKVN